MNVKRFSARTSRDALALVRQAFGDDAVVLSTRPCAEGVEVLAMTPDCVRHLESLAGPSAPATQPASSAAHAAPTMAQAIEPAAAASSDVKQDVQQLAMSTLSFQDYVRERMIKRRRGEAASSSAASAPSTTAAAVQEPSATPVPQPQAIVVTPSTTTSATTASTVQAQDIAPRRSSVERQIRSATRAEPAWHQAADDRDSDFASPWRDDVMSELRSVKGLIEERFGAMAFFEKLQRNPQQAALSHRLLDAGFSPSLTRKLVVALPDGAHDEAAWVASVLARNLSVDPGDEAIEDQGGVIALIGATGVGKTTSTAKIAAAFAARHGVSQLGLITLDAYRVAAHEQLRTYGRILGVPVHTAHDRASLDDLLGMLSMKKMVLIDTAGMAQRDTRTRELLDMLAHRSIQKLLVVNAAAQAETIDDVIHAYRAGLTRGVIISKLDEAVKLGPALDAMIRYKLKVVGVANGQRVPEDWHHLSAQSLVQRALRNTTTKPWAMDAQDAALVLSGPSSRATRSSGSSRSGLHA